MFHCVDLIDKVQYVFANSLINFIMSTTECIVTNEMVSQLFLGSTGEICVRNYKLMKIQYLNMICKFGRHSSKNVQKNSLAYLLKVSSFQTWIFDLAKENKAIIMAAIFLKNKHMRQN